MEYKIGYSIKDGRYLAKGSYDNMNYNNFIESSLERMKFTGNYDKCQ
jgi:hypothetical protein